MNIKDNMVAIGKRNCSFNNYEVSIYNLIFKLISYYYFLNCIQVSIDKNGVIQTLKAEFYDDVGHSLNEQEFNIVVDRLQNCYDMSRFTFKGYTVITEKASSTWTRAPGKN